MDDSDDLFVFIRTDTECLPSKELLAQVVSELRLGVSYP
jgi:hypothetical protein